MANRFFSLMLLLVLVAGTRPVLPAEPVKYILDTDIASDCDDAGAVALANTLLAEGEAEILAMMVSTGGRYGAPALCAINTFYGHGDLPIGTLKQPEFWSGGGLDQPSGAGNYESYSPGLAQRFPTRIKSGEEVPDARVLYRKILAAQPDGSVVVNTVGPLINLAHLMETRPDEHSPMNGMELIRAKVKMLVITGGRNPTGTSSNFSKEDAEVYTRPVIGGWPAPILFVGNEVGGDIKTGWPKGDFNPGENPARTAYRLFHKGDSAKKRGSGDQAGVLIAIRGTGRMFDLVEGHQTCAEDGTTTWTTESVPGKKHAYARKIVDDEEIRKTLEELMTRKLK